MLEITQIIPKNMPSELRKLVGKKQTIADFLLQSCGVKESAIKKLPEKNKVKVLSERMTKLQKENSNEYDSLIKNAAQKRIEFRESWDHTKFILSSLGIRFKKIFGRKTTKDEKRILINKTLEKHWPQKYIRELVEKGRETDFILRKFSKHQSVVAKKLGIKKEELNQQEIQEKIISHIKTVGVKQFIKDNKEIPGIKKYVRNLDLNSPKYCATTGTATNQNNEVTKNSKKGKIKEKLKFWLSA